MEDNVFIKLVLHGDMLWYYTTIGICKQIRIYFRIKSLILAIIVKPNSRHKWCRNMTLHKIATNG